LLGDTRGLAILPFELTSPLPFIEPTFVLALLMGIISTVPVGQWLVDLMKVNMRESRAQKMTVQIIGDLGLIFILFLSIAATASSSFTPSIYGAF
jgi:hypothetical protein